MGIFDTELRSDTSFKKLPTYNAWCIENLKRKTAEIYQVTVIFKPNKFPNYTLNTEQFTIRINENNPLFDEFDHFYNYQLVDEGICLGIKVLDKENKLFALSNMTDSKCYWEELGNVGVKVAETLPNKKPKRSPKKPVSSTKVGFRVTDEE